MTVKERFVLESDTSNIAAGGALLVSASPRGSYWLPLKEIASGSVKLWHVRVRTNRLGL